MSIADLINLDRVKIKEETEESFIVKYKKDTYEIKKDKSADFMGGPAEPRMMQAMNLEQHIEIIPETRVLGDKSIPLEYKEVMMFHEIREQEYANHDFKDAHERAVNDEILYIMKFFDEKTRDGYLAFAAEQRAGQRPKKRKETMTFNDAYMVVENSPHGYISIDGMSIPYSFDMGIPELDKYFGYITKNYQLAERQTFEQAIAEAEQKKQMHCGRAPERGKLFLEMFDIFMEHKRKRKKKK